MAGGRKRRLSSLISCKHLEAVSVVFADPGFEKVILLRFNFLKP